MEIGVWILIAVMVLGVALALFLGRYQIFEPAQRGTSQRDVTASERVPLTPDRKAQVERYVGSGLYDREYLVDFFCGDDAWPECLDYEDVAPLVDGGLAQLAQEKSTWPEVTDCDRLDTAYAALWERGIIALHNAGYTQSDGFGDCGEIYHESPDKECILGCCFYHEQDLERVLAGEGLYFAFGAYDDHETARIRVGEIIREELERAGLAVEWDGTVGGRPCVPGFVWQRRKRL